MLTCYTFFLRTGLLAIALIVTLAFCAGVQSDEKDTLKDELLKLNGHSKEEDQTKQLRALMKDRKKAKELVTYAAKMMKEAKGDEKPFNYNGSLILARASHILKLYDIAEKFYERQLELATKVNNDKKIVSSYEGLIEFYFDTKRYADVIEACDKFMELKETEDVKIAQLYVLEWQIKAKAKQGKIDDALKDVKGLLELTDNSWYFLQTKGWIQRENGKLKDAIATYDEVLDKLDDLKKIPEEDKDKLKDRVRYILSGIYVENKEIDKAADQLKTLIKRNPESAMYKNDLGFIWCDNDMKFEESEKLIKEALELDKKEKEKFKAEGKIEEVTEHAAYLDSLGWVYYKQKKYKEALEPLKKAALDEDEGNHLEIWDHLADCYLALSKKKEAIESWEKALKMEDVSPRDGERRRKVSEKLRKARLEASKD
jgi:tetratricopeptide (TPR) repeat protein